MLAYYGLGAGSTVQLALRGRGGGCGPSKVAADGSSAAPAPGMLPAPAKQRITPDNDRQEQQRKEAEVRSTLEVEEQRLKSPTSKLELVRTLTSLDDRLVEALTCGDIRLLSAAWLLAQTDSFRMRRRQELETSEALLCPEEAVALVRECNRSVGVASHGWLTAGDPDPAGVRVRVLRRTLEEQPHIKAVFFDFPCLFQHPRTKEQGEAFKRALDVVSATPPPSCIELLDSEDVSILRPPPLLF